MAPIRIGFIGLSASSWATNSHFPYLKNNSKFEIVALCNSSVTAAENARAHFELPSSVKCYGTYADIARDPDVDLIVCSVRVDRHYAAIKPALEAGKDVYCEWPLGANASEAEELTALAKQKGVRTAIGLQARLDPAILARKSLLESGRIGRVLSSHVYSSTGLMGETVSEMYEYVADKKVGASLLTIHFGHTIDYILFVLGELESFSGITSVQRKEVIIVDDKGNQLRTKPRETADQIMLQGALKSGGVLSVHQRPGEAFKGQPGLTWSIYGEKGELYITADTMMLSIGDPSLKLRVYDKESGAIEEVDLQKQHPRNESLEGLIQPAKNVGSLYEAWADGKNEAFANAHQALQRHALLEQLEKSSEAGVRITGTA